MFDVLHMSKGVFIDGHERPDIVESREKFLKKMTECEFLHPDNAPTEDTAQALPADVPQVSKEGENHIVWFHNESAYNTTYDTPVLGGGGGNRSCLSNQREKAPPSWFQSSFRRAIWHSLTSSMNWRWQTAVMMWRSLPLQS